MEKKCVMCHTAAATVRCFHCHKPLCETCAIPLAGGSFCTQSCAGAYASFKGLSGRRKERSHSGLAGVVVALIVLAALALLAWQFKLLPWK